MTARLRIRRATTFFARLRGLMFAAPLPDGTGLLLAPCAAVHTAFMRAPIDVVFLDARSRVLRVQPALPPWRAARCCGARAVLELPAGSAARHGIVPGRAMT